MFEEQINFKNEIDKFKESPKAKTLNKKKKNLLNFENAHTFNRGRQKLFNGFESGIFSIRKQTQGKGHSLDLASVHIFYKQPKCHRSNVKIA